MAQAVYLQTYGCQMNERDSEEILGMLDRPGLRRGRARGGGGRHPPEHLLGPRPRRGAGVRQDGADAAAEAERPELGPRHPGLHGQGAARGGLPPTPAGRPGRRPGGDLRPPRPPRRRRRASASAPGSAARPRPGHRPQGAAARPPAGDRLPDGARRRVRDDHGRVRQEVRLLHRADDARPGGLAADRRDPRRGPAARPRRLPPGHPARAERELLRQALPRRLRLARARPPPRAAPAGGAARGAGRRAA